MTSSPGPTPSAISAISSASVPLEQETQLPSRCVPPAVPRAPHLGPQDVLPMLEHGAHARVDRSAGIRTATSGQ